MGKLVPAPERTFNLLAVTVPVAICIGCCVLVSVMKLFIFWTISGIKFWLAASTVLPPKKFVPGQGKMYLFFQMM